ncbi:hypothetical protein [Amycolatopsis decaplanina]|uniref:DUF1990 domain-containing protein n=1 Tax=Amycolatopsis decaplanina DSM 44594 TaxID=1284240 RepID=M2Z383_9PSEU|nr:hypothetical protein [Amycolatopsis decaplanina]EME55054.1 hypothetical protein H074_26137 [Amycolatopsis decaplanina DSM 44594]
MPDSGTHPPSTATAELLADRFAPEPAFSVLRHRVVDADTATTYAAVRGFDFMEVGGPLVRAAGWVRGLPERFRRGHGPSVPTRLTFDDMTTDSDWVVLGERPGFELVAGVAGRFWQPVIEWRRVEPGEFAEFREPGYGKIVLSLSVRGYGEQRSLLSYDIRVTLTDSASLARFRLYWAVASPFIKAIHTATLRTIARDAENANPEGK